MRGATECFKFEVSGLSSVGFKVPNAVAPNEANFPQTKGRDGEAVDWRHKPGMMNVIPLAGRQVERLKPWFGRRGAVRPACQSPTRGHLLPTTYCLRLLVVRGRAVRYDVEFNIMRCLMRTRILGLCAVVGGFLAMPAAALADFGVDQIPQFAQNNAPDWLFQILSSIFLAFAAVLASLLGLGTTG